MMPLLTELWIISNSGCHKYASPTDFATPLAHGVKFAASGVMLGKIFLSPFPSGGMPGWAQPDQSRSKTLKSGISLYDETISQYNKMISQYNKMISQYNKMVSSYWEVILQHNKVVSLYWEKVSTYWETRTLSLQAAAGRGLPALPLGICARGAGRHDPCRTAV
jgi:hypothetical protein